MQQVKANRHEARLLLDQCYRAECKEIESVIAEELLLIQFLGDWNGRLKAVRILI